MSWQKTPLAEVTREPARPLVLHACMAQTSSHPGGDPLSSQVKGMARACPGKGHTRSWEGLLFGRLH